MVEEGTADLIAFHRWDGEVPSEISVEKYVLLLSQSRQVTLFRSFLYKVQSAGDDDLRNRARSLFFLSMVLRRAVVIHGGDLRFVRKVFQGAWMSRQSLKSFSNVSNLSSGESKVSITDQGNCCRSS